MRYQMGILYFFVYFYCFLLTSNLIRNIMLKNGKKFLTKHNIGLHVAILNLICHFL